MVSFSCEVCNDTLLKKKLNGHYARCPNAYFTCIDCNKTFQGNDHEKHTSCITEVEKYQGRAKNNKQNKPQQQQQQQKPAPVEAPKPVEKKKEGSKKLSDYIKPGKKNDLNKVIKSWAKDTKSDKKELLKKMKVEVNDNGELVLKMD